MDGAQLTSWYEVAKGEVPLPLTGPSLSLSPLPAPHPPTVFLFGGKLVVQRRLTAEMWAFDINSRSWSRVDAGKGPGARYFHSMDVWEDKLVCFGGMADNDPHSEKLNVHNDVWMFDCRSRRWLPQPSPEAPISFPDDETLRPSSPLDAGPLVQDPELLPTPRYAHLSAISRGKLIVCGGQRMDNSWIYEMNVFDLQRKVWESKTEQPVSHGLHSKGAYRSVTAASPYRVVTPPDDSNTMNGAPALPYVVDEKGGGGNVWCYSNYDFARVRRELEIISPLDGQEEDSAQTTSEKYSSPPGFTMQDLCSKIRGSSQPPGLRFPTGGIIGNHFVLCGLYLASTSAAFSIWTLDLTTHNWKHIEPPVLASGSWNIVVVDPHAARLLIFGNAQSDLATDYSKRAVSLNHFAVIELEAFGVYQPPKLLLSEMTQNMGLTMLDEKLGSSFDIVCEDGRRIKCSRKVLTQRWQWFAEQQAALVGKAGDMVQEMPSLDINDALLGSLSPARFTPNCLHLPEPLPVCVALVQYFYTLNLATPLQTRAPVLCALLFLAKRYNINRLAKLVVHALHCRLEPSNAIQVYEVAALAGEHNLSARALAMVNPKHSSSSRYQNRRPGASLSNEGGGGVSNQATPTQRTTGDNSGANPPSSANPALGSGGNWHGPVDKAESTEAPTNQSQAEDPRTQLLDALDITAPVPKRQTHLTVPSRSVSRASSQSSASSRTRRLPPLRPPPVVPPPVLPEHDMYALNTPEPYHHYPQSPTLSEATSSYLRTPASSTRSQRDSAFLARDNIPGTPSTLERRPSLNGTPTKKSLPALLEDEHTTELSHQAAHSRFHLGTAPVGVLEQAISGLEIISTPSSSPRDGDLYIHREQAMETLQRRDPLAMLTRAVSLNSLGARAKRNSFDGSRLAPRASQSNLQRRRNVESMYGGDSVFSRGESSLSPPLEIGSHVGTHTAKLQHANSAASTLSPPSSFAQPPNPQPVSSPPQHEEEKLAKFQAFIEERQRTLGFSSSAAQGHAKKATGKAGQQHKSKFGRLSTLFT